jgi:Zn-dependent peptidase ImmA (M78 family)
MKAFAVPMMSNRRALADRAMQVSIAARLKAKKDLVSPVCVYAVAEAHGVRVTFNDIDMEGMYQRGSPPRIHLSARRPLVRRTYNCGHELGHHILGHGSSIDELRENQTVRPWDIPEEYSADTFAAYLLMPTLGLRHAFVARGLDPERATPTEVYRVACHFGVGYTTLVTHLLYGAGMISRARAEILRKHTPKSLRAQILGSLTPKPLIVADEAWAAPTIDVEVGHLLLLPPGTQSHGNGLTTVADLPGGRLFEAKQPGLVQLNHPGTEWAAFARIARMTTDGNRLVGYVGRAEFRHLEEEIDD